MDYPIQKIRADFPILQTKVHGKPLVYLDNAATTQKPQVVIDKIAELYQYKNSNIHRGVHYLSNLATEEYENSRGKVREFINAVHDHEIIFTKGTTDSINLLAFSFGEKFITTDDEILISAMEHHSNIVPWQLLCERKGAKLKVIPFNDKGEIRFEAYKEHVTAKTKIIAITHISNTLGTINPLKEIIDYAHLHNIPVLVDGAQAIQHTKVDVQDLDADFYTFSGHKMYGPNGVGVLYGKESWLEKLPPYQGGGEMVESVRFEKTTYNELPYKFEAGTPNYIDAAALSCAITYIEKLGIENIATHEKELINYGMQKLAAIDNMTFYGTARNKTSVISFLLSGIHHYDTGMILDKLGIAVRTGTHCSEPVMHRFGIDGTVRASFGLYNTKEEIDVLANGLQKVNEMFK